MSLHLVLSIDKILPISIHYDKILLYVYDDSYE